MVWKVPRFGQGSVWWFDLIKYRLLWPGAISRVLVCSFLKCVERCYFVIGSYLKFTIIVGIKTSSEPSSVKALFIPTQRRYVDRVHAL